MDTSIIINYTQIAANVVTATSIVILIIQLRSGGRDRRLDAVVRGTRLHHQRWAPLVVSTVMLLLFGCSRQENNAATPVPSAPALSTADTSASTPATSGPLPAPRILCGALAAEGLATRGWKNDGIDWSCSSNYLEIGASSTAILPTNLAYYVVGDSSSQAHSAKLVLNVNNPTTKAEGLARLAAAVDHLAQAVGSALPTGFREAVVGGRPTRVANGDLAYAVEWERTRVETFYVLFLDASAEAQRSQAQAAAISGAADLFEACKRAIALDLSYPATSLLGDGEPIQEIGYQSFMISGRNRDVFFCEVHANNAYRVKAAFGGNYPFKYVASGNL